MDALLGAQYAVQDMALIISEVSKALWGGFCLWFIRYVYIGGGATWQVRGFTAACFCKGVVYQVLTSKVASTDSSSCGPSTDSFLGSLLCSVGKMDSDERHR